MTAYFIGITTCERPDALWLLVGQIASMAYRLPGSYHVCVVDDASRRPLIESPEVQDLFRVHGWSYHLLSERRGKQGFWGTYSKLLEEFDASGAGIFVSLPDDCVLAHDFFPLVGQVLETRWTPGRVDALNTHVDARNETGCWGSGVPLPTDRCIGTLRPGEPVSVLQIKRIDWLDGFNALSRAAVEKIGPYVNPIARPWDKHPELGSGVGAQLSQRLRQAGVPIYGLSHSLVKHTGSSSSVMNPVARAREPLSTLRFVDDITVTRERETATPEPARALKPCPYCKGRGTLPDLLAPPKEPG